MVVSFFIIPAARKALRVKDILAANLSPAVSLTWKCSTWLSVQTNTAPHHRAVPAPFDTKHAAQPRELSFKQHAQVYAYVNRTKASFKNVPLIIQTVSRWYAEQPHEYTRKTQPFIQKYFFNYSIEKV